MPAFTPQTLDGTLNAVTWTPIMPVDSWDHVIVNNRGGAAALSLRTVQGDATTQITIADGDEQPVAVTPPRVNTAHGAKQVNYRFPAGSVAFYLKTASGTGTGAFLVWG